MIAPRHAATGAARVSMLAAVMGVILVGCGGSGNGHHGRSSAVTTTGGPTPTRSNCDLKVSPKRVKDGYRGLIFETRYGSKTGAPAIRGCWQKVQVPVSAGRKQYSRIRLVPAPGSRADRYRPSGSVMRVELRPFDHGGLHGDVTQTSGYRASRAEVYARFGSSGTAPTDLPDPVGSTRWYSWAMYLPPNFAESRDPSHWLDLTQWKGEYTGSPAVALGVAGRQLVLDGKHINHPLAALVRGRWIALRVGIHFSPVKTIGWITVAIDGRVVLPVTHGATMNHYMKNGRYIVDPSYLKQGIYRSDSWNQTQVAYFGPVKIGTTAASVG